MRAETYEPGTVQQLQFLAACINANAHATGHLDDTNSDTGLGMYPVLSMFNHSCSPNLAHSSEGETSAAHSLAYALQQHGVCSCLTWPCSDACVISSITCDAYCCVVYICTSLTCVSTFIRKTLGCRNCTICVRCPQHQEG